MNVTIVGPAHPYRGGIAHFTAMLAREFAGGHDVAIVNFKRLYPGFLFPGKTQYDDSDSPLAMDSSRVIDSLNPLSWWRAAREVVRRDPDVVVVQWWQPFFGLALRIITALVRRRSRARIVFLCHNVLPHESSIVDRVLIRIGLGRAHAYLVQSSEDEQNLLDIVPGARVAVNPHPIYDWFDMDRYTPEGAREALSVSGRVLLFFGLVRAYKGLAVLLRAFARVAERLDAVLLVVGEFYEDRRPYDRLIAELGIAGRVRVINEYVANEEVEKYFKAADLVVLPYRAATQSGIVQTAFCFEKPVIVTRVGGLPDVVEDGATGFVVPPDDPVALAGAIERFFVEDAARLMPSAIRAGIDRFSWRHCVHTLISLAEAGTEAVQNG